MRVAVKQTEVYSYTELSDRAKEKALEWWTSDFDFFTDFLYEMFEEQLNLLGVQLKTREVRLMSGKKRSEPCIWWSGFWSQGDGACFEGSYSAGKLGDAELHPELLPIQQRLEAVQARYDNKLCAVVVKRDHYSHERCTDITVSSSADWDDDVEVSKDDEDEVADCLREMMRWIYSTLEEEYEYQTSAEAFADACEANEYEFTEDGQPY